MASTNPTTPAVNGQHKRPAGPGRPNYNAIHKHALPVAVEPLPPLIPHNPLSILTILWIWLQSTFWQSPATPTFVGVFSPEMGTIHVTDAKAARALWEMGFFGKGSLSRSEPTWLDREKRKRGLLALETSEEVTRKRRQERKKFKEERAKAQREELETRMKRERGELNGTAPEAIDVGDKDLVRDAQLKDSVDAAEEGFSKMSLSPGAGKQQDPVEGEQTSIRDMEHLQLTLEEAFFLVYGLGVLEIVTLPAKGAEPEKIPKTSLFSLFRAYSTFPPSIPASPVISPADTFVANYAVYHHFRSLGWVIRPGPKFAVDWMLYNRGPPFSHAEFAIITVPSYSHGFWKTERGRQMMYDAGIKNGGAKSWHWLHMTNRVQNQVKKTLVLAFVEMPPPLDEVLSDASKVSPEESPTSVLKRMKVKEIVLRRWVPNRNRD